MPDFLNETPDNISTESDGGRIRLNGIYVGFVKDNRDAQRMGRLAVYVPELGGNPDDESNWCIVSYASPFAGATDVDKNRPGGKTMYDTQMSYGFWAIPPDLNNEVLVCFANGDMARGFWFACLYQQFMNHMVPGIGLNLSTKDEINKLNLPPVAEYNKMDTDPGGAAADVWSPKRPVFEPLHNGLVAQGLYADPERGPQTTSARREAPSKVMGLISPRGNSIQIDDDTSNEFIRFRTRSGAQIVIHETTGYIYMITKQGNSWMEISDIGIDLYSKRSISMRAEENINLHADQNIIFHGAGAVHTTSANITHCSAGKITTRAGGDISRHSPKIKDNSKDGSSGAATSATTPKDPSKDPAKDDSKTPTDPNAPKNDSNTPADPNADQKDESKTPADPNAPQSPTGSNDRNMSGDIEKPEDAKQFVGQWHGESTECVALVKDLTNVGPTSTWKQGDAVAGNTDIQPGTAIATFGPNGTYTNTYGASHAAIYLGQDANGIQVLDQWNAHPATIRTIPFSKAGPEGGTQFYVIGKR